ncbi:NAD(P)H-dependent glycerol-3-phosphate dehydrogenase [Polynucleobacter acidiphobus]|uniref:NAD(P)H-dependent glycerol-3-phosphate dehydrogenase n=1 Tax=Polynucleobacter acidiphobus TaxID=556053 RepID=UPI000D3AB0CA|nr:NAD(P)H-dependent glycerol-3-phosphate dehydrogenase [Polynucleobacter acidiphobus]
MNISVLGAGAWGTAIAISAASHHSVCLWARNPNAAEAIRREQENKQYLPAVALPNALLVESDFEKAVSRLGADDLLVIATPMAGLASTAADVFKTARHPFNILWLCKGLEPKTSLLPHQVVGREQERFATHAHAVGVLSGPSFAREVGEGLPCALTVASATPEFCLRIQTAFHHGNIRVYASDDLIGVELGGAVKNVLAIAAGIGDGLGLGMNARAALLTRGLAEMMRLVKAVGGKSETCMGLTGLGDLILTATGDLSRNRRVGLSLAAGEPLDRVLAALGHVAEGVLCAQAVSDLAKQHQVEMPICTTVSHVLNGQLSPEDGVRTLMGRGPKSET